MEEQEQPSQEARRAKVTNEHRAEAKRLKALWDQKKPELAKQNLGSQLAFGAKFGIGTQAAVGFFLNGQTPLSLKAARGFAEGLGCNVADFSPRLAGEIRGLNDVISDGAPGEGSVAGAPKTIIVAKPLTVGRIHQMLSRATQMVPEERKNAIRSLVSGHEVSDADAAVIDTLAGGVTLVLPGDAPRVGAAANANSPTFTLAEVMRLAHEEMEEEPLAASVIQAFLKRLARRLADESQSAQPVRKITHTNV